MNDRNEDLERKSWESSKSENYEQMPMGMHSMTMPQMQNYNPCMYCPMMYGSMSMQESETMYGGMGMQGNQMMPKYGRDNYREDEGYTPYRSHHHNHYHHYYHPYHHYYHPYPYCKSWNSCGCRE